jgi:hypothetical protein
VAGGHEQPIAPLLRIAVELQDILVTVPPRGGGVGPDHQLDSVSAQCLAQRVAQRRSLAGKHVLCPLDEHHLAAETPYDLRHLDACGPAAQHEQAARHSRHARRLARAPDALELAQPRDRRHERVRARCHDDMLRRVADAVDLHHAGAGQSTRPSEQIDAAARQPALLAGVGPIRHHEVPPGECGLHVDLRAGAGLTRGLHRLPRAQQRLRWDAGPIGALAANQLSLDHGDPQPARSQRRGAVLTRRAATENDHVVVAHRGNSAPAFSAAIWAAGQSGQFLSSAVVLMAAS